MSVRGDDYRQRSIECGERAKLASDPEVKRQFEELARHWLEMAKQVERNGW
jgi:hypothetical protein